MVPPAKWVSYWAGAWEDASGYLLGNGMGGLELK